MIVHTVRRYVYATGYLLMAAAGAATAIYSSPSLEKATAGATVLLLVWEGFLILGGLASAVGALTDVWLGEFMGLPLLASTFAIYAVATGWSAIANGNTNSVVVAFTLTAVAAVILGRWLEINVLRQEAEEARRGHG